jgi:hypothetical protein
VKIDGKLNAIKTENSRSVENSILRHAGSTYGRKNIIHRKSLATTGSPVIAFRFAAKKFHLKK